MLGVKVAAIALTSLGSVTMGGNVYLSTHARSALHTSWQPSRVAVSGNSLEARPAPPALSESRASAPSETSSVVMNPMVIRSRSLAQQESSQPEPSPQEPGLAK